MRRLPVVDYGALAFMALGALAVELIFGFQFYFAPGWANGWPGGLSIYRVWSAGMTAYLFIMMMTVGIGVGATAIFLLCRFPAVRRRSAAVFWTWLVILTGLTAVVCTLAYCEIYASTLEMWPNGYP